MATSPSQQTRTIILNGRTHSAIGHGTWNMGLLPRE